MPEDDAILSALKKIGILNTKGHETFYNCVVFPLYDAKGAIVNLYGRIINEENNIPHLYLPGKQRGLVKHARGMAKRIPTVILTESVIDALTLYGSEDEVTIVFSKYYKEPEIEPAKGRKKEKQDKWVAFLSTDTTLHASSIIKIYVKRWPIEVCFKECKQMLSLGKEQGNDFNAQVFSTMASFLRYNMLMYSNEKENYSTLGELFAHLVDDTALITYADRLWDFFRGSFCRQFFKDLRPLQN